MSSFAFLQAEWPLIFEAAHRAEASAHGDARAACFYARRTLELAVTWLYTHDKTFELPYRFNRRFDLRDLVVCLIVDVARSKPAKKTVVRAHAEAPCYSGVPFPPLERQQAFARAESRVEAMRPAFRASLAEIDALFAALQHRAFAGHLSAYSCVSNLADTYGTISGA